MRSDFPPPSEPDSARWLKWAALAWVVAVLAIDVRAGVAPTRQTVYPIYSESARLWLRGQPLYYPYRTLDVQGGWRYGPTVAVLMIPFSPVPDWLGGMLWRTFNAGLFLAAAGWWARTAASRPLNHREWGILLLLLIPLTIPCLNNGQVNLLLISLLLLGVAAVTRERWNLAAMCLSVPFHFKVYPLAVGMVLALLYPRKLAGRLVLAVVLGLALPLVAQSPAYAMQQYREWVECVRRDDRSQMSVDSGYRDLWMLIRVLGLPVSRSEYEVGQIGGAVAVAGLCWASQRAGRDRRALGTETLALATCWMMLLGPTTESSTYVMLAPSLAWAVLEAWRMPHGRIYRLAATASLGLMFVAGMASWFPLRGQLHAMGPHPVSALLLTGCVLVDWWRGLRGIPLAAPEPELAQQRAA